MRYMNHKLNFTVVLLSLFIAFYGLVSYVFDFTGIRFYIEMLVVLGILFFGIIALTLIYNRAKFGYVIAALLSVLLLFNHLLFYFRREMSTVLFASLICSVTGFIVSMVSAGQKKKAMPVPKPKAKGRKKKQ